MNERIERNNETIMTQKQEQRLIEIRRAKIMELLTNGHTSQVDIARRLNVSEPTVSRDIRALRDRSKKELETHLQDKLPFEYARAMEGINATLKRVSEMLEEAKDPKTKIECMKLQMELWKSVMSLATDGGIIQRATKVIMEMESKPNETKWQEKEKLQTNVVEESSNDEQDEDIIEESDDVSTEEDPPTEEE